MRKEDPNTAGRNEEQGTMQPFVWKNLRAATAKAALTANRHTCGRHSIDLTNSKLLLDDSFLSSIEGVGVRLEIEPDDPVVCWVEGEMEVCVAPVLVCKKVVQTVGGGQCIGRRARATDLGKF